MAEFQSIVPRSAQAQSAPSRQAAADADEPFLAGCRRRAAAFAADVRQPHEAMAWLVITLLAALLAYSYWPGLINVQAGWNNAQYSHGWIVPLFAVGLLFWWRQPVGTVTLSARATGVTLLVASLALRLWAASFRIVTIDMYTLVPALSGVFLLAGGWKTFRWAWAPIAFLIFMYPLPNEATRYLLGPLQTLATMVSSFALQTLGFDAFREGNRIVLGERHLNVVDACSGLRMLTIFVALSVAMALLGGREWWENAIVIASAVPIALIVNSIRITVTGVMYTVNADLAEKIFHDWAGYFMMPLALGMLFLEQQILAWLVVTEDLTPTVVGTRDAAPGPGKAPVSARRNAAGFPGLVRPENAKKMG